MRTAYETKTNENKLSENNLAQDSQSKDDGSAIKVPLGNIVFGLSAIALCAKVLGFAEKLVIAKYFGTSDKADVYFASTGIVLSIVFLVKELIHPSLLPVFAESSSKSFSLSGNLFRKAFLSTGGLLSLMCFILIVFPGFITDALVPGFSVAKRQMTANLLRALGPGILFLGLTGVTYATLNAQKKFLKAAWPEVALKLSILVGLIALLPFMEVYALAVVLGVGGFGCLLVQLLFIPENRFLFKHWSNTNDEGAFRRVLFLMGPLVIGVVFSHISGVVDNILASTLPSGQMSYLGYSKKLMDAILLIGPVALVTVVYSHLSHLASKQDRSEFKQLVVKAFRVLIYIAMPMSCILIGLRQPLVRLMFQRGQFDALSSLGTSQALMIYTFGLVTFSLEALFVHVFFALSDTKTPVKFGVLCVVVDIVLAILLLKPFQHLGIAAAFVVSKTIKVLILGFILNRRLNKLFGTSMFSFLVKSATASAAAWIALRIVSGIEFGNSFFQTSVVSLFLPATVSLSVFALASFALKIKELKVIVLLFRHTKKTVSRLGAKKK